MSSTLSNQPPKFGRLPRPSNPVLAGFAGVTLMMLVGRLSGQDYSWDLLNYHFASPQLLLSGHYNRHVAPSGLQSWFNPIGYIPAYLAISSLPPWLASALLAAASGLNAPLIYMIAHRVGSNLPGNARIGVSFACVAIGMSGALVFSEAGTTFLDSTLSIAVLGALFAAMAGLRSTERRRRFFHFAFSGLLLGAICGLKLTNVALALGLAGAIGVLVLLRRMPPHVIAMFALGGLAGFLATGGWWTWRTWEMFGNPVFPLFNDVFRSPAAPSERTVDTTFLPHDWTGLFTFPWHWLIGDWTPGTELPIVDRRYAVALIGSLIVSLAAIARRNPAEGRRDEALLIALFCLFSYSVWIFAFAILRYLIPLELLSGVLLLSAFNLIPAKQARHIPAMMIIAAFALSLGTRHAAWGRAPFSADWFGARGIAQVHRSGTLYVLPGDTPLGFMIQSFPADARFARVGGTFPLTPAAGLGARAAQMIRTAPHLRSLAAAPTAADGIVTLRRFGLVIRPGSCLVIKTKTADVETCALVRIKNR